MFKLSKSNINELFSRINDEMSLYLPIKEDELTQFGKWSPKIEVNLDTLNTVRSPKDFFFPHMENIADFQMKHKEITIEEGQPTTEAFVLFGVRGCDGESLNLLDKVFLEEPVDTFYQARRENGIVITAACFQPEESCFCSVFNIDGTNPGNVGANYSNINLDGSDTSQSESENITGCSCDNSKDNGNDTKPHGNGAMAEVNRPRADVSTWLIGDTLYWQRQTDKGEALTEKIKDLFTPADSQDEKVIIDMQTKAREIFAKLPFSDLNLKSFTPEALMEVFSDKQWESLYSTCLGCGTCTFICPTCHCYDIQDNTMGDKISRIRCWDSCMYSDFTLMAHGNSRTSQLERFRQRFMHKLIYFPDNNDGKYACTGCGRCVQKCPVSMNIVKVAKALGGGEDV